MPVINSGERRQVKKLSEFEEQVNCRIRRILIHYAN
jgi:hypothetical protein